MLIFNLHALVRQFELIRMRGLELVLLFRVLYYTIFCTLLKHAEGKISTAIYESLTTIQF